MDFERGRLFVLGGKGGKGRVVPICGRALSWSKRYLENMRPRYVLHVDEWALFISLDGTRFSTGGLGNEVTKVLKKYGVRQRTGSCHLFRQSLATLMLEGVGEVRYLQEILGHAKLDTTQIYTRFSIEMMKQIHKTTHPARMARREESGED